MDYKKEQERIIEELLQTGKIQVGQPISYVYLNELYQPYAKQMTESEFASLLGISYGNYMSIKHQGHRAKVLKNKKKEITEEEKQNIVEELLQNEKIQVGQLISYVYFKKLYQLYEKQMSESEFASLLGISYSNYMHIKNNRTRAKVLKSKNKKKEITEEEKQNIVEKLLQSGKVQVGQLINYVYFKELYQPYSNQMSETEFASLLGTSYYNYASMKSQGTRAKVLKNKKKELTEEEKQNIVEEMLQGGKIQVGQPIDYEYFKELYRSYEKQMSESEFASLLGISYGNYNNMKNNRTRAKVLKSKNKKKEITEEEKQNIVEKLLQSGKVQVGQLINYVYFKELYQPYSNQMSESEFASLLGIGYSNYMNIKSQGIRAKVLKNKKKELTEEEKQNIVEEMLQGGKIQVGQPIDYEYFKELYRSYGKQISELEFASLLGISYSNYNNMKNKRTRAKVLKSKNKKKEITEEEKQKIVEEMLQNGKVQAGQLINYLYFKELYRPYEKQMTEQEFASLLGINYSNYLHIKNKGARAKALKNKKKELTDEEKQRIVEELLQYEKIQVGQPISYVYFKDLYQSYEKQISELEFASLLGISYESYDSMKNKRTRAKVLLGDVKRVIYILKNESRYYSKTELENLSQMYGVSIEDIVQYALCNGNARYIEHYQEVLKGKEKLWIGKVKCSKEFANEYAELILNSARKISTKICYKHGCQKYISDMAGEAIEYVLFTGGQIEKNFDNKSDVKEGIESYIAAIVKNRCLQETKRKKEISYDSKFTNSKEDGSFARFLLKDDIANTEEEAIRKIEKETLEKKCAKLVMRGLQEGLDKKQAIIEASKILGIKPAEALTIMKELQNKRKKAREELEIGE